MSDLQKKKKAASGTTKKITKKSTAASAVEEPPVRLARQVSETSANLVKKSETLKQAFMKGDGKVLTPKKGAAAATKKKKAALKTTSESTPKSKPSSRAASPAPAPVYNPPPVQAVVAPKTTASSIFSSLMSPAPKAAPAPDSARSVNSLDSVGDVNPMMSRPQSIKRVSTVLPARGIGLQCEKCLKNVGIKEERKACGKLWHVDCFRCGGIEDDGCKRQLTLDSYTSHNEQPYCRPCYGKLFGPKVFLAGSATLNSFLETGTTMKNDRFAKVTDTDEFLQKQRMSQMSRLSNMSGGSGGNSSRNLSEGISNDQKAQVITALSNLKLEKRIGPDSNCYVCSKGVGLKEQRLACKKTWHVDCFTCGGTNSDGCRKKLTLDSYTARDDMPYCRPCYGKLYGPKGFMAGSATMNSFIETDSVDLKNDRFHKVTDTDEYLRSTNLKSALMTTLSAMKDKPLRAASSAPLSAACFKCSKNVGLKEQRLACKKNWHVDCFTCGGTNSDGCSKTLSLDSYTAHDDMPYCRPCYGKLYGPKGFMAGSATMNSFIENADVAVKNDRFYKVTDHDKYLKGGSALSAMLTPSYSVGSMSSEGTRGVNGEFLDQLSGIVGSPHFKPNGKQEAWV